MALLLKEKHPDYNFEYILTPTGDELPDMECHWNFLEKKLGNLTRINTTGIFDLIRKKKALPNWRMRFCTEKLKIEPFVDYISDLVKAVVYVGLRADEPGRFGLMGLDRAYKVKYPLREWGMGIADVLEYLKSKKIQIPSRTDCGCCFYQKLSEWRELLIKYPGHYEKYAALEREHGHTFRSPGRDTWPAALDELKKEFESGRKLRRSPKPKHQKCRFCSM